MDESILDIETMPMVLLSGRRGTGILTPEGILAELENNSSLDGSDGSTGYGQLPIGIQYSPGNIPTANCDLGLSKPSGDIIVPVELEELDTTDGYQQLPVSISVLDSADNIITIANELGEDLDDADFDPGEFSSRSSSEETTDLDNGPTQSSSGEEDVSGIAQRKLERKKRRVSEDAKERIVNKRLRMEGKEYMGVKKVVDGKSEHCVPKEAKKLGPPCNKKKCKISPNSRFCCDFNEEERQNIFNNFWKNMDWEMRKIYVSTLVSVESPRKRRIDAAEKKCRKATLKYKLKKINCHAESKQVCKTMFLDTLGIKEWVVLDWCKKSGTHKNKTLQTFPAKNQTGRIQGLSNGIQFLKQYLKDLPKLPSHYCRKDTTKLYLEPIFESKEELYRKYKEKAAEDNARALSIVTFKREFEFQNLSLYKPKKDQCDICVGKAVGNISDEEHAQHREKYLEARASKEVDKQLAIDNPTNLAVFTMDVQAVKLSPCIKASAVYYKTKLCVHNFTFYNLATKDVCCYLWHEGEGNLDGTNFATMITDRLTDHLKENEDCKKIIIYSDGCGYQNRNSTLSNALLYFAVNNSITIEQKYLEKGHTQMEVDSVHSVIEVKLKKKEIYLPTDYINICRDARVNNPYTVKYLTHTFFKNFTNINYYSSIRPGVMAGDSTVNDIRCLQYNAMQSGVINYKLNHSDEDWLALPKKPKVVGDHPTKMYRGPLKIKAEKYKHLQDLKKVIPEFCWAFYDNLPHQ